MACREMIGMGVRLKQPSNREASFRGDGQDLIGIARVDAPAYGVEPQHRIDHYCVAAVRIGNKIADAIGRVVEEPIDLRQRPQGLDGAQLASEIVGAARCGSVGMERCQLLMPTANIGVACKFCHLAATALALAVVLRV